MSARPGIPAKLLAGTALLAALVFAAGLSVSLALERRQVARTLPARAGLRAERLALFVREPLYQLDELALDDALRAELASEEVAGAAIYPTPGGGAPRVLVRDRSGRIGPGGAAPAGPGFFAARRPIALARGRVTPLLLGEAEVVLSSAPAYRGVWAGALQRAIELAALLATLAVAGSLALGGALVRPLEALRAELVAARRRLAGGAPDATLPEVNPVEGQARAFGELAQMGEDYRALAAAVNRSRAEARALEERVRQTQKLEAVGQLAGGVAHDFNNMLTPILAYAELLREGLSGDPELAAHAAVIRDTAQRAAGLTRQLLAFSRKGPRVERSLQLHETVRDTVALLARTIDRRIAIETDLAAPVDSILGDPSLVQNAILNLGLNARDAMPEGGRLRFATRAATLGAGEPPEAPAAPGAFVVLEVSDTGVGMTGEVQRRAFEPFFTTKAMGKGTGLGLSAVYGTMREHGGAVQLRSEPGRGTTFLLWFPLQRAAPSTAPAPAETPRLARAGRVLVVEDEPFVRDVVVEAFAAQGWACVVASDGDEALALLPAERGRLDLVVLDMLLPHRSGGEVLDVVRASSPGLPVLVTTGFARDDALDRVRAQPYTALLPKPFQASELLTAAAALLDRARSPGEAPVARASGAGRPHSAK